MEKFTNRDRKNVYYNGIAIPTSNKCPICNQGGMHINHSIADNANDNQLLVVLECTSCHNLYIEDNYYFYGIGKNTPSRKVYPYPKVKSTIPPSVIEKYPKFHKIYLEAAQSEKYDLNEIAGMGYRKALEFLVKDYCIEKFPDKQSDIESELLGPTINRIPAEHIKTLAKAISWIGNDETHYIRRNPSEDIRSMKKFIEGLTYWLAMELVTQDATDFVDN